MRPKAQELLDDTKSRAFQQIQYALMREQAEGNFGSRYTWWENGETKECFVYPSKWYSLRLMEWGGDENQPCFYNTDLGKWDTVLNMPITQLVDCADNLILDRLFKKRNR